LLCDQNWPGNCDPPASASQVVRLHHPFSP
jgi:hypothetical protein